LSNASRHARPRNPSGGGGSLGVKSFGRARAAPVIVRAATPVAPHQAAFNIARAVCADRSPANAVGDLGVGSLIIFTG
jgi:hypothetical protein